MSKKVTQVVEELVTPILNEEQLELVDIEFVKEGKNYFLRVFIDCEQGVGIEECSRVSEQLSEKLDEVDPIAFPYFLEVSSPGIERPLKKEKDYYQAIGKNIYVKTYEPIDSNKEFEGQLQHFDGETLIILIQVKTVKKEVQIPLKKVASARLAVMF